MAKKSITDLEIALIKGLLARGIRNRDIQFIFNRPDRPVNSGRITNIRKGAYGNSAAIAAIPDDQLDASLASFRTSGGPPAASPPDQNDESLWLDKVPGLFQKGPDGLGRLSAGETDRYECKANFKWRNADWLRAVAALANNAGGYIFFGVHDKDAKGPAGEDFSYAAIGMSNEILAGLDPADLSKRIKSTFDPTPSFEFGIISIDTNPIGVIYVRRHRSRPVIATKGEDDIREGDIFYRYPGQSSRIKYSDLRAMLDERDAEAREQMQPMLERLLHLGPRKALIADLEQGELADGRHVIRIDDELVKRLHFIKEGQFDEVAGAATLRLVGDVVPAAEPDNVRLVFSVLTREDVLTAFLEQATPDSPTEYIRWAIEVGQGGRLPLHYFARLAGLSTPALEEFVESTSGTAQKKAQYIEWLKPDAAFHAAAGKSGKMLSQILTGTLPRLGSWKHAMIFGQALSGLKASDAFDTTPILSLLKGSRSLAKGTRADTWIRRAICRLDEILYRG